MKQATETNPPVASSIATQTARQTISAKWSAPYQEENAMAFVSYPSRPFIQHTNARTCGTRPSVASPFLSCRSRARMSMSSTSSGEGGSHADSNDSNPPSNSTEPCTYCSDEKFVTCPVCDGQGFMGRTITCYYCRGKQTIECPLCADDIYRFSYKAEPKVSKDDGTDDGETEQSSPSIV